MLAGFLRVFSRDEGLAPLRPFLVCVLGRPSACGLGRGHPFGSTGFGSGASIARFLYQI